MSRKNKETAALSNLPNVGRDIETGFAKFRSFGDDRLQSESGRLFMRHAIFAAGERPIPPLRVVFTAANRTRASANPGTTGPIFTGFPLFQ
jgi:hypothetical protein